MADNKTLYVIDLKDAFSPKLNKAGDKFDKFDNKVKGATKKGGGLGSMLGMMSPMSLGIAGVVAGVGMLGAKLINAGKEAEQVRVSFQTMFGGVEEGNKMIDLMNEFANVTPFTNEQVIKAGRTLRAFGFDAKEIAPTLKILGDVSAGTGKDFGEMAVIFGQIKGAGRLMGQDLLQLINAGFNPLQIISEKTGKSMSVLKDEMSKGLISFDMVQQAFIDATSEGGLFNNMMEKQSQTFGGLVSTLQGKIGMLSMKMGEGMTGALKPFLNWAIRIVDLIPQMDFSPITDAFKDWWSAVQDILSPITDLFNYMFEGKNELDGFQVAINAIATSFRIAALPIKVVAALIKDVYNGIKAGATFWKGLFSGDMGMMKKGLSDLGSGFYENSRNLVSEEVDAFKKIWSTKAKEKTGGVDLAGAMDLSNLGGGGGADPTGGGSKGSKSKSTTSGRVAGVSSGGIKNVTLNITKLVENINMKAGNTPQDMAKLKDQVTRILVEAASDATRLIGQ